jgi:hypothetical protein
MSIIGRLHLCSYYCNIFYNSIIYKSRNTRVGILVPKFAKQMGNESRRRCNLEDC